MTPLFRQYEAQGRILHRDWDKYDTAHVVFQPKHMSCEELDRGYAWCYDRLFSHASIWKRRPADSSAVLAYLAMSHCAAHSADELRKAGDAGLHGETHIVARRRPLQALEVLERQWSWSDDAHVAAPHVQAPHHTPGPTH